MITTVEYQRKYYQDTKKKRTEYKRKYYLANKKKILQRQSKYRLPKVRAAGVRLPRVSSPTS